jgi:transglutaminase-like putative cysteine protease
LSCLSVVTDALVECDVPTEVPAALAPGAWARLDAATASGTFWELLHPSAFAQHTPPLADFAREMDVERGDDPLATVRRIAKELFERLTYSPRSTRVDSPIDVALESRKGVCQDFMHIMIALVRHLGVPCRYVSGYLFQQADGNVRSADGSTHAWSEAWFPDLGWVGFDPTNNLVADHRHIRVAIGRDYADVPPTRGSSRDSALRAVSCRLPSGWVRPDTSRRPPTKSQPTCRGSPAKCLPRSRDRISGSNNSSNS